MGSIRYQKVECNGQLVIEEIHKVVVHTFSVGDVEDPDLYAAEPLLKWEKSEQGKFIMENAIDTPEWRRHIDHMSFGHKYAIVAELEKKKLAEYYLRWGKQ
jgi:hypothetical protein